MAAAVVSSKALHEQLSIIMGALTKAAVAEICEVVDEGYAVLQMEITRSHKENDDLRKKLTLIESIVARGSGAGSGGGKAAEPEFVPAAEDAQQQAETTQQRRDGDGGDTAAAVVLLPEEFPDVVLIKDEDSDSNDTFDEDNKRAADGGTSCGRDAVSSAPISWSVKRRWPGGEDVAADRKSSSEPLAQKKKKSAAVFSVDSPRSEPGCSAPLDDDDIVEAGGDSACSYSSPLDPDLQLVPPHRQAYSGSGALTESPTNRAELDLSLTWTKPSKNQTPFAHFHQNENLDGDAFGLKLISVTGSMSADCQLSESSSSAFDYDDGGGDVNFALYRDQSGRAQLCNRPPPPQLPPGAQIRRFVCSVCTKTYATSQNLDVHMRIHTGERPFRCGQCGKKFTQSAHLKSHLSVHSGERPYACTLCSRSFIVKYSLKLHLRKCHPDVHGGRAAAQLSD